MPSLLRIINNGLDKNCMTNNIEASKSFSLGREEMMTNETMKIVSDANKCNKMLLSHELT